MLCVWVRWGEGQGQPPLSFADAAHIGFIETGLELVDEAGQVVQRAPNIRLYRLFPRDGREAHTITPNCDDQTQVLVFATQARTDRTVFPGQQYALGDLSLPEPCLPPPPCVSAPPTLPGSAHVTMLLY